MSYRLMAAALIVAACTSSYAITAQISPSTITSINTYETYAVIHYAPNGNPLDCTAAAANQEVAIDWSTDASMKVMYASVLSSYMMGKQVGFGVSSCFTYTSVTIPLVYRIDLSN